MIQASGKKLSKKLFLILIIVMLSDFRAVSLHVRYRYVAHVVRLSALLGTKDNESYRSPNKLFSRRGHHFVSRKFILYLLSSPVVAGVTITPCWSAESGFSEPAECLNGSLVAESAVPGAYQQVCMSLPTRAIKLAATGDGILITQESAGAGRTGATVWNSCLLLTRVLDMITMAEKDWLRGKTVLELGCGTGLASIAAAKLGASFVTATDGNPDVIRLAQTNIVKNGVSQTLEGKVLQWGFIDAADFSEYADIVIGSDLTYNSGTWRLLAETIHSVLKPGGIMIYLSLGHSGFNVNGELNGFLSVAISEGLEVASGPNWSLPVTTVSNLLEKSLSSRERSIVLATGGAQIVILQRRSPRN